MRAISPTPPSRPLTLAEKRAINARADEQGRTVQYFFERLNNRSEPSPKGRLRCVRAVIRDQAWMLAQRDAS